MQFQPPPAPGFGSAIGAGKGKEREDEGERERGMKSIEERRREIEREERAMEGKIEKPGKEEAEACYVVSGAWRGFVRAALERNPYIVLLWRVMGAPNGSWLFGL
jgi:hypothetical protein